MKKYLLTLIVAASAVIHAQAAAHASQLEGYWQPDMEKTLALAKKTNRETNPLEQAMMGKMVFEFQKDKMIVHGPPGLSSDSPPVPDTVKGEGGGKAPAAGELEDISAKPIPDKPAAGKFHGREFKVEQATLEEGSLKLWQGEGFSTHFEQFEIDLSGKNITDFSGQTFTVELNQKAEIDITLAYPGEEKGSGKSSTYLKGYTMKLEFGSAKNGKIPGKIHLRLPDEAGSFVVGTFEAKIK